MRGQREKIVFPSGHSFRVLRWSRNLREVEVVLGSGQVERVAGEGTHWHYHRHMELTLFTAGEGLRFVGDHIATFGPGDLVLLGGKVPHYWHTNGQSAGVSVQWDFPHGHPFWAFPENLVLAPLFKNSAHGLRFTGATAAQLSPSLQELVHIGGPDRLGLLLRLLAIMARAPERDRTVLSARAFFLSEKGAYQPAMAEAVRYLLANFRDTIRLGEILRLTHLSKPTFSRQFKKHTGQTFSDFITHLRLQAVCHELAATERTILDIAFACGFSQISFFNRSFRRILGCNPTQYRNRRRKRIRQPHHIISRGSSDVKSSRCLPLGL
jgi:AraC-like DNA-binding protein/quercetin dioxygenase-like cupin family protein